MNTKLVRDLEEAVVDAWPAVETLELDGWLLRASGGPTHRGNSVATLEVGTELSDVTRIAQAEAWYRERDKLPMFQIGPRVAPKDLDQLLAERGYRIEGEAVTAVSEPAEILERLRKGPLETSVASKPSEAWLEVGVRATRFASTPEIFQGFLTRLGSRCRFALVRDARGEPIASGLGITSEDRLGLYAMFTLPHLRRKGAGKALLRALAQSALSDQMRELYLLVETDNVARGLYAQAGFRDVYSYHYRVFDDARRGVAFC
jgi:GNAT superfamily N-acetyltransferase